MNLKTMSDKDLEGTRLAKQREREQIHAEMHEIVAEQEVRRAKIKMAEVLRALPEETRKAMLAAAAADSKEKATK